VPRFFPIEQNPVIGSDRILSTLMEQWKAALVTQGNGDINKECF